MYYTHSLLNIKIQRRYLFRGTSTFILKEIQPELEMKILIPQSRLEVEKYFSISIERQIKRGHGGNNQNDPLHNKREHTASPTEPSPKIATVDPSSTSATFHAAPIPACPLGNLVNFFLCRNSYFFYFFVLWVDQEKRLKQ